MDKNILTYVALGLAALALVLVLVGGNQPGVGGSTRFPNSDMVVKSMELDNGTATTSLVADKLCLTTTESDGSGTVYFSVAATGWATSSTSCL